jgi:hypothetical protein
MNGVLLPFVLVFMVLLDMPWATLVGQIAEAYIK